MNATPLPPQHLVPGTVVTVQMKGIFSLAHHFALVADKQGPDGLPMVVANSGETGGPGEMTWSEFVKGRSYRAYYPSTLPPQTVLYNAYSMFGTRYSVLHWNCEHFANVCHGRPAHSHQVRGGLALAAIVGGLALAAARA
jgi:Lecithin retinol acyltransferase